LVKNRAYLSAPPVFAIWCFSPRSLVSEN